MAYIKTTWLARLRQYTNRLSLTPAGGGAAVEYDVTQVEGTITVAGMALSPDNLNKIEEGIRVADLAASESVAGLAELATAAATHLADYIRNPAYGPATGAVNAYTFSAMTAAALVDGMSVYLDNVIAANTGAATFNWSGLGAKAIVDAKGAALTAGKMPMSCIVGLRYNESIGFFQLLGEGGEYGTAVAGDVKNTVTIGLPTGVVAGTMPVNAGPPSGLTTQGAFTVIPAGYNPGGTITASIINLEAGVIKDGLTVGGIPGTYDHEATYPITAGDVISPHVGFVNGAKVTGTLALTGDMVAADLLAGKTGYSNNPASKITGTAPAITIAAGLGEGYAPSAIVNTFSATYIKLRDIDWLFPGTVRVSFQLYCNTGGGQAYARIYVNNIAVGIERLNATLTPVLFSEDFSILAGDNIQLYMKNTNGNTTYVSEFKVQINPTLFSVIL